jgi:hypothetical protein
VRRASKGAFRRTAYKVLIDLLLVCFVRMQSSCGSRSPARGARAAAARGRDHSRPATSRARRLPRAADWLPSALVLAWLALAGVALADERPAATATPKPNTSAPAPTILTAAAEQQGL